MVVGAQSFLIGGQQPIGQPVCRIAADAQVEGHESGVLEVDDAVLVVDGRAVERVAHGLSPMLPTGVDVVVVVAVAAADVVGQRGRVVVVDGAALVLRVDILKHDVAQPRAILYVQLQAEQHVLQVVDEVATLLPDSPLVACSVAVVVELQHRRVVFEVFIDVESQLPGIVVVVHAHHPRAQLVALGILILGAFLGHVGTTWHEGVPHAAQSVVALVDAHVAAPRHIGRTAKLGSHLQTEFEGEREEALGIANHQVTGLRVEECAVGVLLLLLREVVLPVLVGGLSVGHVALQSEPAVGEGQHPVVGQRQAHLRHGPRVDAQRLRTAAQLVVLQLHRELLGTHRQHAVQPAQFAIGLLHDEAAGVVVSHGHVESIAHAPMAQRVLGQRSLQASAQIAVGALQRAQSVLVGIQPERCLTV